MNERIPETRHQRAARQGRESAATGEYQDWRDNPYSPGTREYYEFQDAQDEAKKENR